MILGIDEVGRGPWAGPLVVGAVVLPDELIIDGLTDSKKLSAKKRAALDVEIRQKALGFGLGWVHAAELDTIGLAAALRLATIRAVEAVKAPYHEIIIDGTINFLKETTKGKYVTTLPKADLLVPAVSAASIIAKVARDAFMAEQDAIYVGYGFSSHVGYGTAAHQKALQALGVTPLHRVSFAPIAKLLGDSGDKPNVQNSSTLRKKPTAKALGNTAEDQVVLFLKRSGHSIIERNWKNKFCEIDVISQLGSTLYFTEVKYRSGEAQGGALASVTPRKLKQMRFAAGFYMHSSAAKRLGVKHTGANSFSAEPPLDPMLAVVTLMPGSAPLFLEVV